MLVVIHMVRGLDLAQRVVRRLEDEGVFVRMRPVYKTHGSEENYYEIRVLASELEEAREILMESGLI